jgi:hypothetical protein
MTNFKALDGTTKKTVLLDAVVYIIKQYITDPALQILLLELTNHLASSIIDVMFHISSAGVNLAKKAGCFTLCASNPV